MTKVTVSLLAFALFMVFQMLHADAAHAAPQTPPLPKATISGSVLRATTGDPIVRATVTLMRIGGPANAQGRGANAGARGGGAQGPQQQATTDDLGRFQFKDIDQGSYRLFAARNGYARQEYGQRSLNRPGTIMDIRDGQPIRDIVFRLTPAATISGRVQDSNGEPLTGITVQALRSTYDATGRRTLQPAASARTNDLGEYRLYWINPGHYLVSANSARSVLDIIAANANTAQPESSQQAQAAGQAAALFGPAPNPNEVTDTGFALTYFPGTADLSRAVTVDLQPGSETRAVDFTLVRTQRVKVSGRVVNADTGSPPQNATVSITPRDSAAPSSMLDALVGIDPGSARYNGATGEFVVQNVIPGSYWLQVIAQNPNAGPAPNAAPTPAEALAVLSTINTARIPIDVLAADLDNITLTVSSGVALPGRLQIEGAAGEQNITNFQISLQPSTGGASILSLLQGGVVRPAADGTFSIPRVTSGDYRLVVNGLGNNYYIKSARLNQTDVLQAGVPVSSPLYGVLEITLGASPGQVTGNVVDASLKPVTGVQAVLVPDQLRDRQDLYKNTVTDQDGRFTFRGITPGDYRLFAWEDIEPFSYYDAAVLRQYEQQGKLVHIREGASESVEVKLIPVP